MKLIDLTHTIHRNIAVFPGDDPIQLDQIRTLENDGFNNYRLSTANADYYLSHSGRWEVVKRW